MTITYCEGFTTSNLTTLSLKFESIYDPADPPASSSSVCDKSIISHAALLASSYSLLSSELATLAS